MGGRNQYAAISLFARLKSSSDTRTSFWDALILDAAESCGASIPLLGKYGSRTAVWYASGRESARLILAYPSLAILSPPEPASPVARFVA